MSEGRGDRGGAFGTALATVIVEAGRADVALIARNEAMAERLASTLQHETACRELLFPEDHRHR